MTNIIKLIVNESEKKSRIDLFLRKKKKELSRTRIKRLILDENLKINNLVVKDPSKKVFTDDKVVLKVPKPKKVSLKPYNYKLDIVYEDNDLLVIDKPAGIAMHPGPGNYDNTVVNALINYCEGNLSNIGDELRPGIVHRIDKETSGLIVVAKNNYSHEFLSKQFSNHKIKRVYQTLVWGKLRPSSGKIETLIKRSTRNRQMMEVGLSKGKAAVTNYKTLEIFQNKNTPTFSFIECILETGRTHQIRVHMSYLKNNILGDKKYKKKFKKIKNTNEDLEKILLKLDRQFLHAKILGFVHPKTGKRMEFSSILPQELENILKNLRKTCQ